MPDYEQTASMAVEPDDLFDYLADVTHLPDYLPVVNDVDGAGEQVVVDADIHGDTRRAEGWVHVDALERRMEWGAQDGPYHGWLQVDPGDLSGSVVTIHVFQDHESDAEDDLAEALENIRRLVTA